MKNRINNRAGYTLIELLTVITIIGILATIAIPNYRGYRDKAKMVTIYATMHQVMLAQEVYYTDFARFFPPDTPISNITSNPIPVSGTDLSITIPNGQIWTITSEGDKDSPIQSYTVTIETNFDRDQDGTLDSFIYSRTVGGAGSGTVSTIPNLQ